jgi:hypothetical protein
MVESNHSDCKYVEMFTHHIGSIGLPRRRTVFVRGSNTELYVVPNIMSRNRKSNIFREGSAGFKATIDMNKEKYIKVMSPFT